MKLQLEASGLRLRTTRREEIAFVRAAESDPENSVFVEQWSEEDHAACLCDGDCRHLIIEDPSDCAPGGYILLQGLENPNLSMLLRRLVIARKGVGAGPRTVEAVLRFCFDEAEFHRLWLDVREDNAAALRIYERFGFVEEGRDRENVKVQDRFLDTVRMSVLDREYHEFARRREAGRS